MQLLITGSPGTYDHVSIQEVSVAKHKVQPIGELVATASDDFFAADPAAAAPKPAPCEQQDVGQRPNIHRRCSTTPPWNWAPRAPPCSRLSRVNPPDPVRMIKHSAPVSNLLEIYLLGTKASIACNMKTTKMTRAPRAHEVLPSSTTLESLSKRESMKIRAW